MAEEQNESNEQSNSDRGFAGMDEERQREIASKGGSASGGNFKNDPERAAEAGREGGKTSDESRSEGSNQRGGQGGGENADEDSQDGDRGNPGQGGRS